MRFPRTRSECAVSLWEVIKYKEKSYFLVLEADQCISHPTLVPGNHLHSSVTPVQGGCKLSPTQCFTPSLSQGKINCKVTKVPVWGIYTYRKVAALAYELPFLIFAPL